MALDPKLFNAILSMDAYNHGYNAGITLTTTSIGNAVIDRTSSDLGYVDPSVDPENLKFLDQSTGFYAVAYSYNGETIISYRGTNDDGGAIGYSTDINHGYTIASGNPTGAQAQLALDFYQLVAGGIGNVQTANISLTGHSLGGGLAGLMGAVYDQDAVIFNSMAFENAAQGTYDYAQKAYTNTAEEFEEQRADRIWESAYLNQQPWAIDKVGIRSISTEGDVLAANRVAMTIPKDVLNFDAEIDLPGSLDSVAWHSMSTNVIRLFAETEVSGSDWQHSAKYFIPQLYNHSIGEAAGASDGEFAGTLLTNHQYADIMRAALAYSAIEEGTRIFGDTGIRALFDDANDLGKALSVGDASSALTTYGKPLSEIFVQ